MIDCVSTSQCVLCRACADGCPVKAISFVKASEGFLYPEIDTSVCVGCQRCEQICPVLNQVKSGAEFCHGYGATNRDDVVRLKSTSGGVFLALAYEILARGGVVCGAIFNDDFSVRHIVSDDLEQIVRMSGSKYVQSDTSGVYKKVKEYLATSRLVLFSGTPCQIAALNTYLGAKYENLFCVSVICHGVPGLRSWRAYLDIQEEEYKSKVKRVVFRDKKLGWHRSAMHLEFENGADYLKPITFDYYFHGFLKNVFLKSACYSCPFRSNKSNEDMLIGDFWGSEENLPGMDDNRGLSAVLCYSSKGEKLLKTCGLLLREIDPNIIIKHNRNISSSAKPSAIRSAYYKFIEEHDEVAAMRKYLKSNLFDSLVVDLRYLLRRIRNSLLGRKTLY